MKKTSDIDVTLTLMSPFIRNTLYQEVHLLQKTKRNSNRIVDWSSCITHIPSFLNKAFLLIDKR